jgi:hypothetical protein
MPAHGTKRRSQEATQDSAVRGKSDLAQLPLNTAVDPIQTCFLRRPAVTTGWRYPLSRPRKSAVASQLDVSATMPRSTTIPVMTIAPMIQAGCGRPRLRQS